MNPIDSTNQPNLINSAPMNQPQKPLSLTTITIFSTIFALLSSLFISFSNSTIIFSIFGLEPTGAFGLIGETLLIGIISSFIWIPTFILSARDAHHGSRIAKLTLNVMLIYFAISLGVMIYSGHLAEVKSENYIKEYANLEQIIGVLRWIFNITK